MGTHTGEKTLVISLALAAAGILACVAALMDTVMPKGSTLAFFSTLAVLGLVVGAVLVAFTWLCDKCEAYFEARCDRTGEAGKPRSRFSIDPGDQQSHNDFDVPPTPLEFPRPNASRNQYLVTLRGAAPKKSAATEKPPIMMTTKWRGQ
jgi:hypothetical protein